MVSIWLTPDNAPVICRSIDWTKRQLKTLKVARSLQVRESLCMTLWILESSLEGLRRRIAYDTAPWFDMYQGEYDYECWHDAVEGMRGAAGWVRIRNCEKPVWFGPTEIEEGTPA